MEGHETYLKQRVEGLAGSKKGVGSYLKAKRTLEVAGRDLVETNYKDGADLWKKLDKRLVLVRRPGRLLQSLDTASGKLELAVNSLQTKGLPGGATRLICPIFVQLAPSGDEKVNTCFCWLPVAGTCPWPTSISPIRRS